MGGEFLSWSPVESARPEYLLLSAPMSWSVSGSGVKCPETEMRRLNRFLVLGVWGSKRLDLDEEGLLEDEM